MRYGMGLVMRVSFQFVSNDTVRIMAWYSYGVM